MIGLLRETADTVGLSCIGVAPAIDEVLRQYPWAESVICTAISYLPPEDTGEEAAPCGFVARFAESLDYHIVLREKLAAIAGVVAISRPNARIEVCVDTCSLPERKLAILSGVVWPGKNGNVFVDSLGSWVALGEIVTDLPLRCDAEPEQSRCGDCTLCLEACPAGAISGPGVVDSNRCISALTQASGSIDAALRELMGINIYGCDICQQVCPYNAGLEPVTPEFAQSVFPGKSPALLPLITLTAAKYKAETASSSIGWLRRTRIRRNAAIAAGNLRSKAAIEALKDMCEDENMALQETARWAINKIGRH